MELKENDLVAGSSGRFGKRLVYRQLGGKTIIASRPARKKKPDSLKQKQTRETFAEGVLYAKAAIVNDETKAAYQDRTKGNQTAFNLALSDFCKAPQITKYSIADYLGQVGDTISIRAIDDFKVESVKLVIKDSTDSIIEEGPAVLSANGADWIYTATTVNPSPTGCKLVMSAADMPGNVTTREVTLT